MVVFDATVLSLLLWPEARPPDDPNTGKKVTRCKERIEFLVQTLHSKRETIIIPTPVLSEVLVVTGEDGLAYVPIFQKSTTFQLAAFDTLAAIELAEINRQARVAGDKKSGTDAPYQKIKIDRQIVSIGKVAAAHTIYTNDTSLSTFAAKAGIKTIGVHELPLPPESAQIDMMDMLAAQEPKKDEPDPDEMEDDKNEDTEDVEEGPDK